MKHLIYILILITFNCFSQVELTEEEQYILNEIATPENIQKWADNKKLVQDQEVIIKEHEKTIIALENKLERERKLYEEKLFKLIEKRQEIDLADAQETDLTNEIDVINETIIEKLKLKWSELHLFFEVGMQNFDPKQSTFGASLTYEFKKFEIGLQGGFQRVDINYNNQATYQFNGGLLLNFKIF